MELIEAYKIIEKYLADTNKELGFSRTNKDESALIFKGNKGLYRLSYDAESDMKITEQTQNTPLFPNHCLSLEVQMNAPAVLLQMKRLMKSSQYLHQRKSQILTV